ncbi:MAG TPA: DUF424 family protein [Candidatus Bilamarchaeum sp.]|nr:DUF424 family protein [Candidatus Bilamarchaeum sp.]
MYLKIHPNPKGAIVAACDEELLGKVLEDKGHYMDLERYKSFYVGEKAGKAELKKALGAFASANLVGKGPVDVAISLGLAEKKDVMYIKTTPYIQIYRL